MRVRNVSDPSKQSAQNRLSAQNHQTQNTEVGGCKHGIADILGEEKEREMTRMRAVNVVKMLSHSFTYNQGPEEEGDGLVEPQDVEEDH